FLPFSPVRTDICQLRIDSGPCLAIRPSWAWDNRRKRCVQFRYGGCGGNPNRFPTKLACELACLYRVPAYEV
ncbi:Kunitz-type serine protease inhibitor beta-bungarotoxin B2 chain, partial [Fasciola gigantica]